MSDPLGTPDGPLDAAAAVERLLEALWRRRGSDLMLTPGTAPLLRIDGDLERLQGWEQLTPAFTEAMLLVLLTDKQRAEFAVRREIDLSFSWRDQARFRVNGFRQRGSVAVALRLIPYELPDLDELGVPDVVRGFTDLAQGLVLVTGPTGSGKSTTLAALVDRINVTRPCHILTIEDPIEYVHRHKRAAVNQREVGTDTDGFAEALRSALREDPDVLLVGEMRDLETIQTALTIAETGHLVFATLHTNDTAQALDRIVDVFPGDQQTQIRVQLANALTGIVYQRLLPRKDSGRVAAYEVLIATPAVRNLIREGKTRQIRNVLATASREGMQTLEQSLTGLVADGVVDHQTALGASIYPNEVLAQRR
ncbi:MAG: twitching motility protein PilT [Actinomycetota bacterium]|nr:twitching motility protein PilT [Actinomycetota bacterium]